MRVEKNEFVKRVYERRTKGGGVRVRPPVKWINIVSEYWSERVRSNRIECPERECMNRERWRRFSLNHPMEGSSHVGARHQRCR